MTLLAAMWAYWALFGYVLDSLSDRKFIKGAFIIKFGLIMKIIVTGAKIMQKKPQEKNRLE